MSSKTRFRFDAVKVLALVLGLGALLFASIFFALASTRIVQRTDSSQDATVGLISIRGWPMTFESTAPGYSHPEEINPLNFELDTLFYFLLGSAAISIGLVLAGGLWRIKPSAS